jgi:nicotinamidase/pyrazinamidase
VTVPNQPAALHVAGAHQILLEKQTFSCFSNINLKTLLDHYAAERYVVYGVVTEVCVKLAAFGLLETGKRVEIVTDAICALSDQDGSKVLSDFKTAGGHLTQAGMIYA